MLSVRAMENARSSNQHLYWRVWREVRPYSAHLAAIFLLGLLSPVLALLTPLPLKIAVDSVIDSHPLPRLLDALLPAAVPRSGNAVLVTAVGLVVLVALLGQFREFATSLLAAYTGEKLLRSFRAKLFRHVQRLSLAYHDTKGTADSTYRIQHDATSLRSIAVEGVVPFIASACTLVAMIFVTAQINWKLAVIGLGISPVIFLVSRKFRRRLRHESRKVKGLESSALAVVQEVLGAARVVKAFGQEDREEGRFVQKSDEGMQARLRLTFIEGTFAILVALITASGMASV